MISVLLKKKSFLSNMNCWIICMVFCHVHLVYFFSTQGFDLQSAERNWKADGASLLSQAEGRVPVRLRGLSLSGGGRCEGHHLPTCPSPSTDVKNKINIAFKPQITPLCSWLFQLKAHTLLKTLHSVQVYLHRLLGHKSIKASNREIKLSHAKNKTFFFCL